MLLALLVALSALWCAVAQRWRCASDSLAIAGDSLAIRWRSLWRSLAIAGDSPEETRKGILHSPNFGDEFFRNLRKTPFRAAASTHFVLK
jgi:hypothetical protein